eukprot:scaffold3763_cov165-Amphora_coffeaeformis.AAC.24
MDFEAMHGLKDTLHTSRVTQRQEMESKSSDSDKLNAAGVYIFSALTAGLLRAESIASECSHPFCTIQMGL